jgi:TPR repeat protein
LFFTATEGDDENFIATATEGFREEWKINGLVVADNGIGDALVLLPDDSDETFRAQVFVVMHETGEIKTFAESLDELLQEGPHDYSWSDDYYLKLNDDGSVSKYEHSAEGDLTLDDIYDDDYKLRHHIDDLIDDEKTGRTTEILDGLEKLTACDDKDHAAWAFNKLSDIYLRGFGPVPKNLDRALEYNQHAMGLGSHKAYSNRAACYFAGIGMERDLHKALEMAKHANELSKKNQFADIFAKNEGGGMYDELVEMLEKEIKKARPT